MFKLNLALCTDDNLLITPEYMSKNIHMYKNFDYECIVCNKEVEFRRGDEFTTVPYFLHCNNDGCDGLSNHSESQEHKRGKLLLKQLLQLRILKYIDKGTYITKIIYPDDYRVESEYKVDNGRADVVLIDNKDDSVIYTFEICYIHKTKRREGKWFEINAVDIKDDSTKLRDMRDRTVYQVRTHTVVTRDRKTNRKTSKISNNSEEAKPKKGKCGICGEFKKKVLYNGCKHYRCKDCAQISVTCAYCKRKK